jgi:hypothetical protein
VLYNADHKALTHSPNTEVLLATQELSTKT